MTIRAFHAPRFFFSRDARAEDARIFQLGKHGTLRMGSVVDRHHIFARSTDLSKQCSPNRNVIADYRLEWKSVAFKDWCVIKPYSEYDQPTRPSASESTKSVTGQSP